MKIDRVTMTGPDNSTDPAALIPISKEFPIVEWGILFSKSSEGHYRFPTEEWVHGFMPLALEHNLRCSAHLCGRWVRDMVDRGDGTWMKDRKAFLPMFQRIQINFHADKHTPHEDFYKLLADMGDKQFIFQMDDVNNPILERCLELGLNAVPLFDVSGGAGIIPDKWPQPYEKTYCGYAGGLGPDSLSGQLGRISAVVGDRTIWIDMETRIRSNGDSLFDLGKVVECLKIQQSH